MISKRELNTSETNYTLPYSSKEIPAISEKSLEILKKFCTRKIEYPESLICLNKKVEKFEKMAEQVVKEKQHSIRNKLLSLLAITLILSIIAGGIIGIYYLRPGTVGGEIVKEILSDNNSIVTKTCAPILVIPLWLFSGLFIPPYRTFYEIPKLEKSLPQQKEQIEKDIKELKTFFSENSDVLNLVKEALKKKISEQEKQKNTAIKKTSEELKQAYAVLEAIITLCTKENIS